MKFIHSLKSKLTILLGAILSVTLIGTGIGAAQAAPKLESSFELTNTESGWTLVEKGQNGKALGRTAIVGNHGEKVVRRLGLPAVAKFAGLSDSGVPLAVVASANKTHISWANDVVNSEIHVYVDGSEIATAGENPSGNAQLDNLPGESLNISAVRVHLDQTANTEYATADFTQQVITAPLADTQPSAMAALAVTAQATTTKFRQTTFIPDAYLDAPQSVCTPLNTNSYRFLGDARSWSSADSAGYRTRMDVTINWLNGPSVILTKNVGTTVRQVQNYFGTWVSDTSATAPNTSMTMTVQSKSANSAIVRLSQNVKNPLCNSVLTNGIYADTLLAIYRTGAISGSINYLAMPNYELYLRQDSGAYSTVARLAYINPWCLVVGFGGAACTTATSF
jgi:hypothetical protein